MYLTAPENLPAVSFPLAIGSMKIHGRVVARVPGMVSHDFFIAVIRNRGQVCHGSFASRIVKHQACRFSFHFPELPRHQNPKISARKENGKV
jgi:hypothetical protein